MNFLFYLNDFRLSFYKLVLIVSHPFIHFDFLFDIIDVSLDRLAFGRDETQSMTNVAVFPALQIVNAVCNMPLVEQTAGLVH